MMAADIILLIFMAKFVAYAVVAAIAVIVAVNIPSLIRDIRTDMEG